MGEYKGGYQFIFREIRSIVRIADGENNGSYLFLGKAETLIGPVQEKFEVIDKRWKIYKKG